MYCYRWYSYLYVMSSTWFLLPWRAYLYKSLSRSANICCMLSPITTVTTGYHSKWIFFINSYCGYIVLMVRYPCCEIYTCVAVIRIMKWLVYICYIVIIVRRKPLKSQASTNCFSHWKCVVAICQYICLQRDHSPLQVFRKYFLFWLLIIWKTS